MKPSWGNFDSNKFGDTQKREGTSNFVTKTKSNHQSCFQQTSPYHQFHQQ